jgi:hypothetical protein
VNFEKLLAAFDTGICADQLQREALFELALLFIEIDGVETEEELLFIDKWVDDCEWNSHISKTDFRDQAHQRVKEVLANDEVEHFIHQKSTSLVNSPVSDQAIKLVVEIIAVDGELAEKELEALGFLKRFLR